jgi:hypothetical protein
MKKQYFAAAAALTLGLAAYAAEADLTGSATAHVFVNVNSNVGVQASTPVVDAGTVQTGDFTATATFAIQANEEQLKLTVDASNLFKGDDPNSTVTPISLKLSEGAIVTPSSANPVAGGSTKLNFVGPGPAVNGFPTQATEVRTYESSQNGIWSQSVAVKVTYNQPDPLKPQGEYSGVIRLTALVP